MNDNERNRRPWNAQEDRALIQAVLDCGENDNWKAIARLVPGRTNKACRKRWLHSLSPSLKKSAWTPQEDQQLLDLYAEWGSKWSAIARQIPGRTDDACSKRYREALDPSLKKDEWTSEEDVKLLDAHARLGGKWGQVGQELGRSGLGCRNRWRLLERKKASNVSKDSFSPYAFEESPLEYPTGLEISSPDEWTSSLPAFWTFSNTESPATIESGLPAFDLMTLHSPSYLLEVQEELPLVSQTVPPFQYSSSSLSSALLMNDDSPSVPPAEIANPSVGGYTQTEDQYPGPSNLQSDLFTSGSPHAFNYATASHPSTSIEDTTRTAPHTLEHVSPTVNNENQDTIIEDRDGADSVMNVPLAIFSSYQPSQASRMDAGSYISGGYPIFLQGLQDDNASTSSSPIGLAAMELSLAISPNTRSPVMPSPISLPRVRQLPPDTLEFSHFSPPNGSMSSSAKRRSDPSALRLSSNLTATSDPSVLPYACGFKSCWPPGETNSRARYATSGELSDHFKAEHSDNQQGTQRPYRCALEGCKKSWKNINGLQYHLQISTAHFRNAITSNFSPKSIPDDLEETVASAPTSPKEPAKAMRLYPCPHSQCSRVYRQHSGLRYHLRNGHPPEMPAQLDTVPPTLARQVADKLRAKDSQMTS